LALESNLFWINSFVALGDSSKKIHFFIIQFFRNNNLRFLSLIFTGQFTKVVYVSGEAGGDDPFAGFGEGGQFTKVVYFNGDAGGDDPFAGFGEGGQFTKVVYVSGEAGGDDPFAGFGEGGQFTKVVYVSGEAGGDDPFAGFGEGGQFTKVVYVSGENSRGLASTDDTFSKCSLSNNEFAKVESQNGQPLSKPICIAGVKCSEKVKGYFKKNQPVIVYCMAVNNKCPSLSECINQPEDSNIKGILKKLNIQEALTSK
jgi:hypothetical protein